jgi:hypothetical protein
MKIFIFAFLFAFLFSGSLFSGSLFSIALAFEKIGEHSFPADVKFEKHRFGGISGLSFRDGQLWAVSDDRGRFGPPRIYQLKFSDLNSPQSSILQIQIESELTLPAAEESVVMDMEAIAALSDGSFLISSEGDLNKEPRSLPFVRLWHPQRGWGRSLSFPKRFSAETTGFQTKGLVNNSAFEALAINSDESQLLLFSERPLFQNKKDEIEYLSYRRDESPKLTPKTTGAVTKIKDKETPKSESTPQSKKELKWSFRERRAYLLDRAPPGAGEVMRGVTEVILYNENTLLLLERWVRLSNKMSLVTGAELFSLQLKDWKKKKLFSLEGELAGNWEGMTRGPDLPDGRKTLVLVTDNNFEKGVPTRFLFLAFRSGRDL